MSLFNYTILCMILFSTTLILSNEGMIPLSVDVLDPQIRSRGSSVISINGCTGLLISKSGLVLTNRHCVVPFLNEDIWGNGFAAKSMKDEIGLNQNAFAFIEESYTDITNSVLTSIEDLNDRERYRLILKRIKTIEKLCKSQGEFDCEVKSSHLSTSYTLVKRIIVNNIDLVFSPADQSFNYNATDFNSNWSWPRKTRDFAILRINVSDEQKAILQPSFINSAANIHEGLEVFSIGYPRTTQRNSLPEEFTFNYNVIVPALLTIINSIIDGSKDSSSLKKCYNSETLINLRDKYLKELATFARLKKRQEIQDIVNQKKTPRLNRKKDYISLVNRIKSIRLYETIKAGAKNSSIASQKECELKRSDLSIARQIEDSIFYNLAELAAQFNPAKFRKYLLHTRAYGQLKPEPVVAFYRELKHLEFEFDLLETLGKYHRLRNQIYKSKDKILPDANSFKRYSRGTVYDTTNRIEPGEFNFYKNHTFCYRFIPCPTLLLVVNFLSSVDATSGSSGSPTFNLQGDFLGLIFDVDLRNAITDWHYSAEFSRTVHVSSSEIVDSLADYVGYEFYSEIMLGKSPIR